MSKNSEVKTYKISGMHCASCAQTIKRKVDKLEGVEFSEVNYATEEVKLKFDEQINNLEKINTELNKYGYEIKNELKSSVDSAEVSKNLELKTLQKEVWVMIPFLIISIFMMMWEIGMEYFGIFSEMPKIMVDFLHHLLPIMATYTMFAVGAKYLTAIVSFVKHKVANMNTLVGIGTLTAYLYSFLVTAFKAPLSNYIDTSYNYYDVTIVVIGFITLGRYLEKRAKHNTGEAIKKLLDLQVKSALVVRDGKEVLIPVTELKIDDVVIVKPGQKIPSDGQIIEGESAIDESMITGESIPVDKKMGDLVIGATINKQGFLKIRISKLGNDTVLSQIIKMVQEAQGSKAPIEKMVDKISSVFVPVVLVIAILTFFGWLVIGSFFMPASESLSIALKTFVGVLVIACPCAMGLATPMSVIAGVGRSAQSGILVKNAESLEKMASVDYIVFDKTGTITHGKPDVTDLILSNNNSMNEKDTLEILMSLEKKSEHSLAEAIVKNGDKQGFIARHEVTDFLAFGGKGLKGKIDKKEYYVGNLTLAKELKIDFDQKIINDLSNQGKTPVLFMDSKIVLAYVGIADTVKKSAHKLISKLHQKNVKTALLTGDNQNTANFIAKQAGIDLVIAEVLPDQKAEKIKELQKQGFVVAMVGDGINDAPALATADVGIAMGTGTDVAIESAGVTLLGGNIEKIGALISLSKATMKNIKQNLFWAFFYNVLSIPVASGIFYPFFGLLLNPAIAGGAMAFSSVSVVLNSLRLKKIKINN